MSRSLAALLILISLVIPFAAQTSPTESQSEKEKLQKEREKIAVNILDSALSDAATLKLAHNRAVIFVLTGDLYWKFDETKARDLFRSSESEILIAEQESQKETKTAGDAFEGAFDFVGLRNEILPIIAKRDAELALKILVATRPGKLLAAMARVNDVNAKPESGSMTFNLDRFRIQRELELEQQFAVLAAEQDPEKAIKLFKESLEKGLSIRVMPLLEKVNTKDSKKAAALADDIVRKIVDSDLVKRREDMAVAVDLLTYNDKKKPSDPKAKPFKFSNTQLRDIANKLSATFLQAQPSIELVMTLNSAMPAFEKIIPEKAGLLRQKQTEARKSLPAEVKEWERQAKFWDPASTAEDILAEIPNLNELQRITAYLALQPKISAIEDESRARKLIQQIPDEKERSQITEQYESARIGRSVEAGKLDEAKELIKNLQQKNTQIKKLVALAVQFSRKKTEKDSETALALMKDAKALANEYPEDETELNDLMEIVRGYAVIDPPEAFRLFEPIAEQLNDFVQASAILSKYNKRSRSFKKGELMMQVPGSRFNDLLLFRYAPQITLLGRADLGKMNSFSDKFQRSDVRTIVKLLTVRGFLTEEDPESADDDESPDEMVFSF